MFFKFYFITNLYHKFIKIKKVKVTNKEKIVVTGCAAKIITLLTT